MLEAFEHFRYDVITPGEGELALGEDFEKAAKDLKGPVVLCANLVRESDGQPVFAPWLIKALPSGKRIGIIGLTSPFQAVPAQYRVAPLETSLRESLAALAGKADAVIVAGFLDGKPALDLAVAFPKVALVLGGRVPKGSPDLLRRGGAGTGTRTAPTPLVSSCSQPTGRTRRRTVSCRNRRTTSTGSMGRRRTSTART
jgi:2',3'-cyclic-nucleotide 2'-phosphodiesterase (5'-nucleotidase family)